MTSSTAKPAAAKDAEPSDEAKQIKALKGRVTALENELSALKATLAAHINLPVE